MDHHSLVGHKPHMPQPGAYPPAAVWDTAFLAEGDSQGINLRDILLIVFKHKIKILVVFVAMVILAAASYFFYFKRQPPQYEAKAILMLRYGSEYTDVANPAPGRTPLAFGQKEIMASEALILSSRNVLEKLIDKIGLEKLYPEMAAPSANAANPGAGNPEVMERALFRLGQEIVVDTTGGSQILTVSYKGKDRELSARVVNELVALYKDERLHVLSDPATLTFLRSKVSEYYDKVKESEAKLEAFKDQFQIYSYEEQMSLLNNQRQNWENVLINAQTLTKQLQGRVAYITEVLEKMPAYSSGSDSLRDARARLLDLEAKERDLATRYTDKNRMLVTIRSQIEVLRNSLRKSGVSDTAMDNAPPGFDLAGSLRMERIQAQQQLNAADIQIADAKNQIEGVEKQIQELAKIGNRYQEVQREVNLNQRYYETYLNKLEEVHITDDMKRQKMTSVSVVQDASAPAVPVQPPKSFLLIVAIGAGLGLAGGLGLAFLLEFIGQRLTIPRDVEKRLGMPVLITIPRRS